MAKWRDTRRFGPGPYLLGFRRERQDSGFPFNLAAIETIERLDLDRPITLSPRPMAKRPRRCGTRAFVEATIPLAR